jgi:potassium-dependent mechanosensitive channel
MKQASFRHQFLVFLAALLVAIASIAPATAQAPPPTQSQPEPPSAPAEAKAEPAKPAALPPQVADGVARLTSAIESAEKTIQHFTELEDELGGLRVNVETILAESADTAESLRPQLAAVRSQIEKLGPPPDKDGVVEAPALAAERARLTALESDLDAAIKSTVLTWERARQLIEKITVLRHSLFTRNIMERRPSPLLPGVWRDVLNKAPAVGQKFSYQADYWLYWANLKQQQIFLLLGAALVLFIVLELGIARRTNRRRERTEAASPPSFFERAKSAAGVAPLRALPAVAASVLVYVGLDAFDLLYPPYWARIAPAILKSIVLFSAVTGLIFALLAPGAPQWRLVPLAESPARRVGWLLCAITAAFAIDTALTEIFRVFSVPLALSVVQSFAASALFAALLICLLLTPFTPQPSLAPAATEPTAADPAATQPPYSRHAPVWLKLPLWLIALGILGLALLGYVALARFLAQQVVMTGIVIVVSWLLYLAIRAVTRDTQQRRYPVGEMLEARFGLDAPRRNQLARLTEIALTFALIICALPFLMLQWGYSSADIRDGFKSLFFGIEVGQFRISLARIMLGIVLFIALLFATRLLQRWLREKALQQTRMDPGIVNSIDTVVGYVGTALAALLAVSYAGLDITNLAIVAGALSVGIGFGLQSIVNNFVSGLILLVERPIRVGDRIVIGDQQGLVRRISVRATEIETFDRASLIVPNSELIMGRVLNWTHRDSLGAVNVKIGVGYDSDPEQVIAILKKCADGHRDVLRTPAPVAIFESFGDSALMFNLRISLPDIANAGGVQSDLRIAILKALREANIEIPFNQVDVNLRDLDAVRRYLTQYIQERAGKAAEPAQPDAPAASNGKRVAGE